MASSVLFGDGIAGLRSLLPGSGDLILSDLPSGETQAKFDHKADLSAFWPAAWQALRSDGICVLMASSLAFAAELRASELVYYRYERIWRKTLATGHLNARRRPLRAHEYVLVFWRVEGVYTPQMTTGHGAIHKAHRTSHGENYGAFSRATDSRAGATDRYPTSVLDFSSVGTSSRARIHPQQKPVDLLVGLIATYSRPGDLVADPCAGSGSTGVAASQCNRRALLWDNCSRFARS
jgi:site-specific DNA-methyltransferase (adenine-specific)